MTPALARLRARRRRWALLAVPALALRALIPVGFMPVAAQGIALELCPDAAVLPPGLVLPAQPPAHQHHHHSAGAGHDPSSAAHHAPCLFAAGATLATAPPAVVLIAPPLREGDTSARLPGARRFVPSILRAQSPRAPPTPPG
jgi:hypothetical protein